MCPTGPRLSENWQPGKLRFGWSVKTTTRWQGGGRRGDQTSAVLEADSLPSAWPAYQSGLDGAQSPCAVLGEYVPASVATRPHCPLDAWRQLHRVVQLADFRKRRHYHLGNTAGGLPVPRPRFPGIRTAGLSARSEFFVVYLQSDARQISVHSQRIAGVLERRAQTGGPSRSVGADCVESRETKGLGDRPRQRRFC